MMTRKRSEERIKAKAARLKAMAAARRKATKATQVMILYHRTTAASAKKILRGGFRDGVGTYLTPHEYSGVWLSNVPLDINEGAEGDTLLEIKLSGQVIADYEWIEEGKPYREWLVPARLINERATSVRVVDEDEEINWR